MADKTGIEWTDASWNPVVGCSIVSPGCTNCYAMAMAGRIERMGGAPHYAGTTQPSKAGAVWTGKLALAPDHILTQPLRWTRGRRIFVNSMGDLFHEDVPDDWIDRVFAVMALASQHSFQILTKRSARMRAYLSDQPRARRRWEDALRAMGITHRSPSVVLLNVWLGVSAEDQRRADERIPDLLATPAAIRFVSAEPLLGPIDFENLDAGDGLRLNALDGLHSDRDGAIDGVIDSPDPQLDWIIVGGESGPGARPMSRLWVRSIRDQSAAAGTAFFFKQWGAWRREAAFTTAASDKMVPGALLRSDRSILAVETVAGGIAKGGVLRLEGKKRAGRILDGVEHNAMPAVRP